LGDRPGVRSVRFTQPGKPAQLFFFLFSFSRFFLRAPGSPVGFATGPGGSEVAVYFPAFLSLQLLVNLTLPFFPPPKSLQRSFLGSFPVLNLPFFGNLRCFVKPYPLRAITPATRSLFPPGSIRPLSQQRWARCARASRLSIVLASENFTFPAALATVSFPKLITFFLARPLLF